MTRYNYTLCFVALFTFFLSSIGTVKGDEHKQQHAPVKITGVVVDTDGIPLMGVTVSIKEKTIGLFTDKDGKFDMDIPIGTVLKFTYVGMITREIRIQNEKPLVVTLENNENILGEAVITGYDRTTTRRTTGSVASLSVDRLVKESPLKSIDQLLQGQVAGVSVRSLSGRPGESAEIRIRGVSTLTGNAQPLWVLDGVPLPSSQDVPNIRTTQLSKENFNTIFADGLFGINPNDIENITILKDASATAIYGSRGGSGVIVVTTKRGKSGKPKINFSSNFSIQTKPQRDANLMNSREKLQLEQELWDEFSADGFAKDRNSLYPVIGVVGQIRAGKGDFRGLSLTEQDNIIRELGESSTDWFDELFRNSFSQSYNLSMSGGSDKNSYYMSINYLNNSGLVKKTSAERYGAALKIDTKISSKLMLATDIDFSTQVSKQPSLSVDPFRYAYYANPYESLHNKDGSYRADHTYFTMPAVNGAFVTMLPAEGFNIMRETNETSNKAENVGVSVRGNLTYAITNEFKLVGMASYSYSSNTSDNINGENTYAAWRDRPFERGSLNSKRKYGSILQASDKSHNYNLRAQFQYNKLFADDHHLSALIGSELRGRKSTSIFSKRYGYDSLTGQHSQPFFPIPEGQESISVNDMIAYAKLMEQLSGQAISEERFASFYFSTDYTYKRRYTTSFTVRTDGSSYFGVDRQFNPTGSLGFAWMIDEESFMQSLKPIISSLTVKLSSGFAGNTNKSVYPQLILIYDNDYRIIDDEYYRTGQIRNAPNRNLRWERVFDYKGVVDVSFLDYRIKLIAETYYRKTKDAVTSVPVVSTTGFPTQSYNTSELENKGLEFTLSTTNIRTGNFTWTTAVNIGYNLNKLLKYENPRGIIPAGSGYYEGYPTAGYFGGKLMGVDPETGLYKYHLRPEITSPSSADLRNADNYKYYLGNKNAPITGGFNTHFTYKNVSLGINGSYSFNAKVINNLTVPSSYTSLLQRSGATVNNAPPTSRNDLYTYYYNSSRDVFNRWTPNNRNTNYPRIIDAYRNDPAWIDFDNPISSSITDGAFLESVSYLKITSISMSYSVPTHVYKKFKIEGISVFASANNILTFTKYSGIDPETPGAVYPPSRTYSVGFNVSF